jgi:LPXTG-site transpeptidase (sortase) family protein
MDQHDPQQNQPHNGHIAPLRHSKVIQPLHPIDPSAVVTPVQPVNPNATVINNPAVELIRQKLDQLYGTEPDAAKEEAIAEATTHRSPHQAYMHELTQSGKTEEEIQISWHAYYARLSDAEKRQVWQEFYDSSAFKQPATAPESTHAKPKPESADIEEIHLEEYADKPEKHRPAHRSHTKKAHTRTKATPKAQEVFTVPELHQKVLRTVQTRARAKKGSTTHSLLFGLTMGLVVMAIMLFGFFNERFIAPFMTPSRTVTNTPIIIDPTNTASGPEPLIIIPKINVEIPVVYDVKTIKEEDVQAGLERGVVHYVTTPNPGELGNSVIFGHSANNILNKGKYKFAFVLLRKLELGDTFYVQKDSKRYAYRVFEKKIVPPTDISVLNPTSKPATMTLITCDPPGTALNRLVVVGEQISPDPTGNAQSTATPNKQQPQSLPSEAPSLWSRLTSWMSR